MSCLFKPITVRQVTFKNRIGVSPMCQYSSHGGGFANDWHLVHLGARAVGGAGLVIMEATAVEERGCITLRDTGIWSDDHVSFLKRISRFVAEQGSVPGIQLAHAGRKALSDAKGQSSGLVPVGPSALPFDGDSQTPHALTKTEIAGLVEAFAAAARRAKDAGFQLLELGLRDRTHAGRSHCAHGSGRFCLSWPPAFARSLLAPKGLFYAAKTGTQTGCAQTIRKGFFVKKQNALFNDLFMFCSQKEKT